MSRAARLTIGALAALLLLSLAASAWLAQRSDSYYRELNAIRLDPLGATAFEDAAPGAEVNTPDRMVVLFGDSRAADWPPPTEPPIQIINRGVGAQTSAQVRGRYALHVAPLSPDILILQVGINDLKTIAIFPEQRAAIIAQCLANIEAIADAAHTQGATVIITTIFPPGDLPLERRPYWSASVDTAITEVNSALRSMAGDQTMVLDAAAILANEDGRTQAAYQHDFLHLNAAGYAALNQELGAILESLPRGQ
jgi:lysophospholipase L1-like esterase